MHLVAALALLTACGGPVPTAIRAEDALPGVYDPAAPAALPAFTVIDADGNPLEPQPTDLTLTIDRGPAALGKPLPDGNGYAPAKEAHPGDGNGLYALDPDSIFVNKKTDDGKAVLVVSSGALHTEFPLDVKVAVPRISGPETDLHVGATVQLDVCGNIGDYEHPKCVRTRHELSSLNPEIATVNEDGVATGIAPGDAHIQVQIGSVADAMTVHVVP